MGDWRDQLVDDLKREYCEYLMVDGVILGLFLGTVVAGVAVIIIVRCI